MLYFLSWSLQYIELSFLISLNTKRLAKPAVSKDSWWSKRIANQSSTTSLACSRKVDSFNSASKFYSVDCYKKTQEVTQLIDDIVVMVCAAQGMKSTIQQVQHFMKMLNVFGLSAYYKMLRGSVWYRCCCLQEHKTSKASEVRGKILKRIHARQKTTAQ